MDTCVKGKMQSYSPRHACTNFYFLSNAAKRFDITRQLRLQLIDPRTFITWTKSLSHLTNHLTFSVTLHTGYKAISGCTDMLRRFFLPEIKVGSYRRHGYLYWDEYTYLSMDIFPHIKLLLQFFF